MKKILIEDIYQAKLNTHPGYSKNRERPEESKNYCNKSCHKFVNQYLLKVTKNHPSFPDEDSLIKSLFLGIQRLERKWTSKIHN